MERRQEKYGTRDLDMSGWIRRKLPSRKGFMVCDIDFYIFDYVTKTHAILEVKTRCAHVTPWQKIMYKNLAKDLRTRKGWKFLGAIEISLQHTEVSGINVVTCLESDKRITLDEEGLVKMLSLDTPWDFDQKEAK